MQATLNKIEQVKQAIEDAKNNKSKLTERALQLPSFSSAKIKHLLNNLGAISNWYLEIGLHKSGTFIATLFGNSVFGIGVDNWSQFEQDGVSKKLAYENTSKLLPEHQYKIIEQDCFEIPSNEIRPYTIDLYNYDGEHSTENQKKGITHFYPFLADVFVLCVDDYSWEGPREGTLAALRELDCEVLFHEFLWNGKENSEWHNGFSVFVIKKNQK